MAISIDTVYQKVLALANKEQRGYITPQEFNLMADKAQMDIYDSYFHDFKTVDLKPKVNLSSDDMELIQEKLHPFKKENIFLLSLNSSAFSFPSDMYRLNRVMKTDSNDNEILVSEMSTSEILYSENNPLTKATLRRHVFERRNDVNGVLYCNIYPKVDQNTYFTTHYYKIPSTPKWNYVVVNSDALYNSTGSVDFELHISEEEALVSKILALSGIVIMSPEIIQYGSGMEAATKQSQND